MLSDSDPARDGLTDLTGSDHIMSNAGYQVSVATVDVSSREAVLALVGAASAGSRPDLQTDRSV